MLFIQSHALFKFAYAVLHIAIARERTGAHLTTNQEKAFSYFFTAIANIAEIHRPRLKTCRVLLNVQKKILAKPPAAYRLEYEAQNVLAVKH